MAQCVVDLLEFVQIEADHREFGSTTCHGERLFHAFPEQHAVGQSGQCVVAGHERDARRGLLSRGDVLMRRDPAATRHGLIAMEINRPFLKRYDIICGPSSAAS